MAGRRLSAACAAAVLAALAGLPTPARADDALVALTDDGALLRFQSSTPAAAKRVAVSGVEGRLLGIDYRPADGKLYGVSDTSEVWVIDPTSGAATFVSTLTIPFDAGLRSGVDFNPQSDRLRLTGATLQNLRAHQDIGATAADGALAYLDGDANAGKRPDVTASAYTSSVPNAPATKLFDIDATLDVLAIQEPPNDGKLATVGPLGVDFGDTGGFDIRTDASGEAAYAASGATLYGVELATGKATALGTIGDGTARVVGLAVVPAKTAAKS